MHFPSENGVSFEFLICDIAVRPMPEMIESSVALNCRWGNFSARKSRAAKVVVSLRLSSSGWQIVAAEFGALRVFILCEVTRYLRFENSRNGVPMDTFYRENWVKTSVS